MEFSCATLSKSLKYLEFFSATCNFCQILRGCQDMECADMVHLYSLVFCLFGFPECCRISVKQQQTKNTKKNKNVKHKSNNILFKNKHWIDLFKKNGSRTVPMYTTTIKSPFKIIYTNIVALWLHRHSVILKPA